MTLMIITTRGKRRCTGPKTNRHSPAYLNKSPANKSSIIFSLLNRSGTSLPVLEEASTSGSELPVFHATTSWLPSSFWERKNPQKGKQKTEKLPIVRVISGPSGDGNSLFSNSRETSTQTAVKSVRFVRLKKKCRPDPNSLMRHWRDQDLWPTTEAQTRALEICVKLWILTHTYDILKYKCWILEAKWMISQDVQRFKMSDIISHWLLAFYVSKLKSIYISGGPLSALTCCVNVRLLSAIKKNIAVNLFSKLVWELGLYYASYDDFHPDILARMYT